MGQTRLYTIFDRVAGQAGPLYHAVNDGVALRQYNQILKDVTSPGDYDLLCVGSFDHYTCVLEVFDEHESIFPEVNLDAE